MPLPRRLTTPDLVLEATTREHAEGLWRATEASLRELRPWMLWARDADFEGTSNYVTVAEQRWSAGLEWNFTIFKDGDVAGSTSLHRYDPMRNCAEIGYWLRSDLTGRGLMTQAVRTLVGFGFDQLRLHRIELLAGTGNLPSIRVAEKCGFTREGELRQATPGSHGWYDAAIFGLLETDHRPR